MKFKSIVIPKMPKGYVTTITSIDEKGVAHSGKLVLPDQSLSIAEILDRFTRGEKLPIGNTVNYHESDDDLEKIQHMDLLDREEFIEKQKQTQKDFDAQEKKRKKAAQAKLETEALARAKDALARENPGSGDMPPTPPAK